MKKSDRHDGAHDLDRRQAGRAQHDGLVADRQRQGTGLDAEDQRPPAAQHGGDANGRHDDRHHRPAQQRPQHDPFQAEAETDHRQQDDDDGRNQRRLGAQHGHHDHAGQHDEFALGEVDGVGRLVDKHEAQRDQRIHQADRGAAQHQRQQEFQVSDMAMSLLRRRMTATPPFAASAQGRQLINRLRHVQAALRAGSAAALPWMAMVELSVDLRPSSKVISTVTSACDLPP